MEKLLAVLAVFAVIIVWKGVIVVRQAEVVLIERLGKYQRRLEAGVNVIIPFLDRPRDVVWLTAGKGGVRSGAVMRTRDRVDMRETVLDFPQQRVITADNVVTEVNGLLFAQITDPIRAVYEVSNLPMAIEKLAQTTLRNIIGELDLDKALSSRDEINTKMREVLDDATDKWGVKVNRVELQDINPPPEIQVAMEKQMRAERDRRATVLEAEGQKTSQILRAEGVRDAQIAEAEGEKQRLILDAEGEAGALRNITEGLHGSQIDPAQYLIAMEYIRMMRDIGRNDSGKTVFMPYEAAGVLGSIGSLKELLGAIEAPDGASGDKGSDGGSSFGLT